MREVVHRRYARVLGEEAPIPDLIVIDGGKGQLSSAVSVLAELGLGHVPVIGLAKRLEEVFLPGESLPQNIAKTSPGLKLLQRIRDEAHRFAVTYHRERRSKATLQTELETIDGVGPKRAQSLLTAMGSVRAVAEASPEDLAAIVGWSAARNIHQHFTTDVVISDKEGPHDDAS
jgi:excinuclease ABC subunit C